MLRNGHMVLTVLKRGEAEVAPVLASDGITELPKDVGEIASRQIAGKPHTAMTSSRTW